MIDDGEAIVYMDNPERLLDLYPDPKARRLIDLYLENARAAGEMPVLLRQCAGCGRITDTEWPRLCPECEAALDEQLGDHRVPFPRYCSFPALMLGWWWKSSVQR